MDRGVTTRDGGANAWVDRVLRAAERDDDAAVAFLRVTSLVGGRHAMA